MLSDLEIARAARLRPVVEVAEELGLSVAGINVGAAAAAKLAKYEDGIRIASRLHGEDTEFVVRRSQEARAPA